MTIPNQDPSRPGLRWSSLSKILTSPLAYIAQRPYESASLSLGTLVHTIVFGEADSIVVYDGERRGKAWQEFKATYAGKTIATQKEYDRAKVIAQAVLPTATEYDWDHVEEELSWSRDGVQCGGRPDLWAHCDGNGRALLLDLKTTRALDWRSLESSIQRYHYHGQLAWYADGIKRMHGVDVERWDILWVSTGYVPEPCWTTLDPHAMQAGRALIDQAFAAYQECVASGEWPGMYPDLPDGLPRQIGLPVWASDGDDCFEVEEET